MPRPVSSFFKSLNKNSLSLYIAFCLGALGALVHFFMGHFGAGKSSEGGMGYDDAYISFRYAENLFLGNGLVYNVGENVEGYSNFLYTLLVTPAFFIGKDFVYPFSVILNLTLLGGLLAAFFYYTRATLGNGAASIGVFCIALSPFLWLHTTTGMETILVAFVVTGSWVFVELFIRYEQRRYFLGLVLFCLLSILSRIDGFILPVAVAGYLFLRGHYKSVFQILALIILAMGVYSVLRWVYYDDVIGNTYYNKISGDLLYRLDRGLSRWWRASRDTGFFLYFGIFVVATIYTYRGDIVQRRVLPLLRRLFAKTSFAFCFICLWSAYAIYIGWDVFQERLLIPLLPLGVYLFLLVCRGFKAPIVYFLSLGLLAWPYFYAYDDERFAYQVPPKYDFLIAVGQFFKTQYPGKVIAVEYAGKIPFVSGLRTIDMLGLNDRHIAKMAPVINSAPGHMKYDPEYVLSKSPDFIATWTDRRTFDLLWGMTRRLYYPDYELAYLVNITRTDFKEKNIIDVSSMSAAERHALILEGQYLYAILGRLPPEKRGRVYQADDTVLR